MAITINSVKCPGCGADLPIEEGRTQIFCSYCGTKVIVTNENEHIYRHIDEAEIKKAETERIVELKKVEIEEKKLDAKQKAKKLKVLISLILGAIMLVCFGVGFIGDGSSGALTVGMVCAISLMFICLIKKEDDDTDADGKIKVPSGIDGYEKKSYVAIEAILKGAGFTNIQCIPLNDLTFGILKKPNMVDSITINGKEVIYGGKKFPSDASIIITYHSITGK